MSAAEVKKLPIKQMDPIDGTKPVELQCLFLPSAAHTFGASTSDRYVAVGGYFKDGSKTSGHVMRITAYPSGFIYVEIREGYKPGVLDSEQEFRTCFYMVGPGGIHGRVEGQGK